MKIALLIPTHNRPSYLRQCFEYLKRADLSKINQILVIDDCSTDAQTIKILSECGLPVDCNHVNLGIKGTLLLGYEKLFKNNDVVINLDSDALVRTDFVDRLIEAYKPKTLLTGFHSVNTNRDGSQRHEIIKEVGGVYLKKSVGGINFITDKYAYKNYLKPALQTEIGNFDHMACIAAGGAYCLKESVIQHIGFDSSLNHWENPDVAESFKPIHLPNVTLLCVDSNAERIKEPLAKCTSHIKFGDIVCLHPDIRSKEKYSNFMIKEAYKHIKTDYVLIFQYDGFVHNWESWNNQWLEYDYIGAPWHYTDGMAVGNGGFSLRTKRLMEILGTDQNIKILHPEDHHICRTYRKYLEDKYQIKFAPVYHAENFSFEGYMQPKKFLDKQFGRHGSNPRTAPIEPTNFKYIVGQFASLGDIIWLVPLVRALIAEGNSILWPVNPEYLSLKKHFPDINFVDKNQYNLPYESHHRINTPLGQWLPYRFASENMGRGLDHCMTAKYQMYGHDWQMFRSLTWDRDLQAENELAKDLPEKYIFVNRYFGHLAQFQIEPKIESKLPVVEMSIKPGFTIFDWVRVIEGATEIHTANTGLLYVLERLDLKMPIHLYSRKGLWGESGFSHTQFLHTKPYILHQ